MDPTSRPRRAPVPKSGGKMVRPRRTAVPRTPYERPSFPNYSGPENPNWISRLILSPTRIIATGTGKLFSSVFGSDSSSSDSSASDSPSEDEIDDDNNDNDNDITSQGADRMEMKNGTSIVWKSETKHIIEQLLLQETFSREECDRLTSIIRSRVVDCLDTEDGRLSEIPNRTVDVAMPDLCSAAVMEAKKWLEEKKSGSNSKSELDLGICTLNSAMLPYVTEGEVGSPVDVAKSYMQTRPPWASPSVNHIEFKSPLLTGKQLFKEGTPYSIGGNSMCSSKLKRDSSATGSWNILEEIRKVRSKATEEMLRTQPSSKIDWSAFASEHKSSPSSFAADKLEASVGDKMVNSAKSVDASLNLTTAVTSTYGFPVSQMTQDGLQDEASPPNPTTFISEQNQDLEANQIIEGTEAGAADVDGHKDTNGTTQQDSRLQKNCSESKEVAGTGGAVATNGLPSSGYSLSAGLDGEQIARPPDEERNPAVSSHDKINTIIVVETCELLSEASIEVPIINENDSIPTGSQNSSSMHHEGLSEALTQPNSKRSGVVEKQQGRKVSSRYNRKGRGRGK